MRVVFPQLDYITSAGTKMVVFPNEEQWARLFEAAKGLPGATVVDAHGDRRDLWMLSSVASDAAERAVHPPQLGSPRSRPICAAVEHGFLTPPAVGGAGLRKRRRAQSPRRTQRGAGAVCLAHVYQR